MARRSPAMDPELKAHQEWLGYLQPVGLVVAPAAMQEAGWVVTRSGSELIERQARYRAALEPLDDTADPDDSDTEHGFRSLLDLLTEHLGWDSDQLDRSPEAIQAHTKELQELGDTLTPTAVVPAANGEGAQLLVVELPLAAAFDQKSSDADHLWRASAQERLERLLRETGVEAGLLFNGSQLRLVVAPKGESSGHLTFRLSELAEVSGRLMLSGLDLLLGQSHVFLDPDGYRLSDVLKKSRSFQAVVSNALADQVLAALWDLLRGFQQADELSQQQDDPLLGDLPERDPQQLYGGLITMLMRLVFLLYAEDEALMPSDAVYEQNYKLSAIFEQLQQDESEYPDTMEQRFGAWAGLMSLCRLVFDGGGPTVDYLPARHGQLFDPDVYPWLESPWISDGVVLAVLRNLLIVQGERISYRALDVEQIGSVYEGIMGYAVQRIPGRCIGLKSKPQGAKKQITTAVDLDALLEMPGAKRKKWLEDEAGTTLPTKAASALKTADSEDALVEALAPRINRELFDGPQAAGSLVFQPTEERRRSGSHYTPRSLTRPIVEEALRPWMERCDFKPAAAQILDLKICDPAMGSGAFLVESCRYLAELLEQAWTREGLPDALKPGGHALGEEPLIYARRLIAQSCLYGVDKNPFAVNMSKLSIWLVSLSKNVPFTFVDHCLKCGDSLVGVSLAEIDKSLSSASRQLQIDDHSLATPSSKVLQERFMLFSSDSRSDEDEEEKRKTLDSINKDLDYYRITGDLIVASFFLKDNKNKRRDYRNELLEQLLLCNTTEAARSHFCDILNKLYVEESCSPFHWDLAFPDVFQGEERGFDVIVGNPPYLGGSRIWPILGKSYPDWLRHTHHNSSGKAVDLVAHFFRKSACLVKPNKGAMGLLATSTIYQGDTRKAGLRQILNSGASIYSAERRVPWEGDAGVVTCKIFIGFNYHNSSTVLDGINVSGINSYLIGSSTDKEPVLLQENKGFCFNGAKIYGEGFSFSSREQVKEGSISEIDEIVNNNPHLSRFVAPYIGGKEITSDPAQSHYRKVIDFTGLTLEEAYKLGPLIEIVKQRVKPYRDKLDGYSVAISRRQNWWLYGTPTPALNEKKKDLEYVLTMSETSKYTCFALLSSDHVFSQKVTVFCLSNPFASFGLLSSSLHLFWSELNGSTRQDSLVYSTEECFGTFPLPIGMTWDSLKSEEEKQEALDQIEALSSEFLASRSSRMIEKSIGMTDFYNEFHDPYNDSPEINANRDLFREIDSQVFRLYGFNSGKELKYGFYPEYLDFSGEKNVDTAEKSELILSQKLFIDPAEAVQFEERWQLCTGKRTSLPWRFRLCDEVKGEILAFLLDLNFEKSGISFNSDPGTTAITRTKSRPKKSTDTKTDSTEGARDTQLGLEI